MGIRELLRCFGGLYELIRSKQQRVSGVRGAYLWTAIGNFCRYLSGFAIAVALARLLPPTAYGIIGMVTVVMTFPEILQDSGVNQAIVYFREDSDLAKYFTISLVTGLTFTTVIWFIAPLVAAFYHAPDVTLVLRVMGLTFP